MSYENALHELIRFYETLTPGSLATGLEKVYAADARFKDPFNDVRGHAAIGRVFSHMFDQLDRPCFVVTTRMLKGSEAFLVWDMVARPYSIHGASHIIFGADGRVVMHRDYWDAAGELYEKFPVVGKLIRWIRNRLAAN